MKFPQLKTTTLKWAIEWCLSEDFGSTLLRYTVGPGTLWELLWIQSASVSASVGSTNHGSLVRTVIFTTEKMSGCNWPTQVKSMLLKGELQLSLKVTGFHSEGFMHTSPPLRLRESSRDIPGVVFILSFCSTHSPWLPAPAPLHPHQILLINRIY